MGQKTRGSASHCTRWDVNTGQISTFVRAMRAALRDDIKVVYPVLMRDLTYRPRRQAKLVISFT